MSIYIDRLETADNWGSGPRFVGRPGTHAKNVDFPHPASPSRSKETELLLSG